MSVCKQRLRASDRITVAQSQKLVESILSMSFGCVAFLRGFFDVEHFEDQLLVVNQEESSVNVKKDAIKVKTLVKGQSKEADLLIDWLELAVSDSLKKKYLKAVCLSIILDDKKPDELFESYTFRIDYDSGDNPSMAFQDDETFLGSQMSTSRKHLQQLMKRLIVITQSLPDLPPKRFLSMRLWFNDSCPKDYNPSMFQDCSNEETAGIHVPVIKGQEELDDVSCGEFSTKHHTCFAKVLSIPTQEEGILSKNTIYKKVDPFDLIDNSKVDEADHHSMELSQITKELQNLGKDTLHDLPTQLAASSVLTDDPNSENTDLNLGDSLDCCCGATSRLYYSDTIKCEKCQKLSHAVCYGHFDDTFLSDSFICLKCSRKSVDLDVKIIVTIRKMIKLMHSKPKESPSSIEGFMKQIGFDAPTDSSNTDILAKALTVILYNKIFLVKSRKFIGYFSFDNTCDGVLFDNQPLGKGRFYLRFDSKSEDSYNQFFISKHNFKSQDSFQPLHTLNDEFESIEDSVGDLFDMGTYETDRENITAEKSDLSALVDLDLSQKNKKRKVSMSVDTIAV